MANKIEALWVRHKNLLSLHDNDTIVAHLSMVCAGQYESVLVNVELMAAAAGLAIKYDTLVKQMVIAYKVRQGLPTSKNTKPTVRGKLKLHWGLLK